VPGQTPRLSMFTGQTSKGWRIRYKSRPERGYPRVRFDAGRRAIRRKQCRTNKLHGRLVGHNDGRILAL
jgi:hypothetical protein